MPNCMECGKSIKLTQWNVWYIFHFCEKCEERLEEEAKCPYCKKYFPHLRTLIYKQHMTECKRSLEYKTRLDYNRSIEECT